MTWGCSPDLRILAEAKRATRSRREVLFRETPFEMMQRWILGTAWTLKPSRAIGLPALAQMWLADLAATDRRLPDPRQALNKPPGLCGIVHDLSVPTLVEAHRRGLFTFAHFGPLKWMSPPERCVLSFDDFHMSKRLRSRLRQSRFRVTFDRDFERVIKACAGRRNGKWHLTWITPQIMHAYCDLHDAGYAHSFEVWNADGALVGGGYGVAVGGAFTIESQFTLRVQYLQDRIRRAQLASGEMGLPAQRQQGTNPQHPRNGLRGGAARGVPRAGWPRRCAFPTGAANGRPRPICRPSRNGGRHLTRRRRTRCRRRRHWRHNRTRRESGAALLPVVGTLGSDRIALAEAFCALL